MAVFCAAAPVPSERLFHRKAPGHAEPRSWYWNSPRKPVNTIIVKADEGKHVLNANILLTDTGDLLAFNELAHYGGDTNVTDAVVQWHRSTDGGQTWSRCRRPDGFPEVESGFASPPIKLPGGALLTVGSYAWENHPNTRANREKFTAKKLYLYIHDVQTEDSFYLKTLGRPCTLRQNETFVLSATVQCRGPGAVTVYMQGPDGGASMNGWQTSGGKDGGVGCLGRDREGVGLTEQEIKVSGSRSRRCG